MAQGQRRWGRPGQPEGPPRQVGGTSDIGAPCLSRGLSLRSGQAGSWQNR